MRNVAEIGLRRVEGPRDGEGGDDEWTTKKLGILPAA